MQLPRGKAVLITTAVVLLTALAGAEPPPITLTVDATDAPRNLLHARLHIPAPPGELTLFYPEWIPGEHIPSGPVNNLTGLTFTANGTPLEWRRDPVNMFTFHLTVPAEANAVDVSLDFLVSAGGGVYSSGLSSTPRLLDLNWNQVLLYPQTALPLKQPVTATLTLPAGWQYGTALPLAATNGDTLTFAPAPLETLIDSPLIAGQFLSTVDLTPGDLVPHFLHVVADSADDLAALGTDTAYFAHLANLVHEEETLVGAHHYRAYHFLLTASDQVAHFGLEHHESSDDRVAAKYLTDSDARRGNAGLLPHEMFHSWNGKYRRPAGLATPDYQQPMEGELLWVYEGLTTYYGAVLAVRSGLDTPERFREGLAGTAAVLDRRSGRQWRPLADTTLSAQLLYRAPGEGLSRRRGTDFYPEGELIWLEADTLIRAESHGSKSLDDFCHQFHGGESSGPKVVPYTYDDVVQALNQVLPYDWNGFFQKRIYEINPHAPLGGIETGGWHLAWTNEVPPGLKMSEDKNKFTALDYSLGFSLGADGAIGDVLPGSPADQAGIFQGMKLVAVNGRAWSAPVIRTALQDAAHNGAPLALLTVDNDFYRTLEVDYHGGEKYPVLERDAAKSDLLDEILKPLTPPTATNSPAAR